jgi:uncharacterized membrane protein (DUF373 family)
VRQTGLFGRTIGVSINALKEIPAIRLLERLDQVAYLIAGFVLVAWALAATGYAVYAFATKLSAGFLEASITLINDILLALIVLELLRTVMGFIRSVGQPNVAESLIPFLVIGGISATRRILAIGATIGVEEAKGTLESVRFGQAMVELGVSGGLILAIGITLVILRAYLRSHSAGGGEHSEIAERA